MADLRAALARQEQPSIDIEHMIRDCVPGGSICDPQQVADALRAYWQDALAQQEQAAAELTRESQRMGLYGEPVAWPDVDELAQRIRWINGNNKMGASALAESLLEWLKSKAIRSRREWVSLTDEQIDAVTDAQWAANNRKPIYAAHRAYARAVEQTLKERNA